MTAHRFKASQVHSGTQFGTSQYVRQTDKKLCGALDGRSTAIVAGGKGVMQWLLVAVGAFYAFAGVVVLRRMAMNRVLDLALEAITLEKTDFKERLQSSLLAFGGCLTLASGLALMTLSPWATVFFAANAIFQGGYLLWAWKALPPESEAERKGRQQPINAFIVYLAAFAFVAHAHSHGVFSHWPINAGNFTWLVELMVIVAVSAGLWAYWFFTYPVRVHPQLGAPQRA